MSTGLGAGKTAPRLQEDILQYDPRKEVDRGYNVLTEPPPPFDGSNVSIVPKGSCRHVLFIKYSQSKLPETVDELKGPDVCKVAAICQSCRYHIDIVLDLSQAGPHSRLCPNDKFPLHHFVFIGSGTDPSWTKSRRAVDSGQPWHKFQCTAGQCNTFLSIQYRPPRLSAELIALLTSKDLLRQRYSKAASIHPDRPGLKRPIEALDILRTYLRDALDQESTRSRVPMRNKAFMAVFGDDCHDLLEFLGFRASDEGVDDGFWYLPKVTAATDPLAEDNLRRMLEDVLEELLAMINNAPEPEDDKRNLKSFVQTPLPALKEIGRCLSTLDYEKSPGSRTVDLTAHEHPYYAGLGAVADFSDELLLFAYRRQSECDATNGPYYFECLQGLAEGRQSEALQTKAAMLASEGHVTRRDVESAYAYFTIDPNHAVLLQDSHIIGQFQSRLPDIPPGKEREARERLRTIGQARGSKTIIQAASEEISSYEEALAWLNAESDTPDEFITTLFTVRSNENLSNADLGRKAVHIIAEHRNSDVLRRWLRNGDEVAQDSEIAHAYVTLEISDRTSRVDPEALGAWLESRIQDQPFREAELRHAAMVIERAMNANSLNEDSRADGERSRRPPDEWPVGLKNIGNTCYLNSLLQYFFTITELRDVVLNFEQYKMQITEENIRSKKVGQRQVSRKEVERAQDFVDHLAKLFRSMISTPEAVVRPEVKLACLTLVSHEKENTLRLKSPTSPHRPDHLGAIDGLAVMGPLGPPLLSSNDEPVESALTPESRPTWKGNVSEDTLIEADEANNGGGEKMDLEHGAAQGERKQQSKEPINNHDEGGVRQSIEESDEQTSVQNAMETRRDSMEVDEIPKERTAEGLLPGGQADPPSHPSRPPPVPPRITPSTAESSELADAAFAANQQDVTEVIDNVFFQLRCAIKAESSEEDVREQNDRIKTLFYGTLCYSYMKPGGPEPGEELFNNLIVNVADGDRNIYTALDDLFDPHPVEIEGKTVQRYASIGELPHVLQINVQRVGFDREKKTAYKIENRLELEEVIYLDRYLSLSEERPELLERRKESWRLKEEMRKKVDARRDEIVKTDVEDLNLPEAINSTSQYVLDLEGLPDSGVEVEEVVSPEVNDTVDLMVDLRNETGALKAELNELATQRTDLESQLSPLFSEFQSHGYHLYAMFIHRGDASAQGGHYWIYIKDFARGVWRKYNDEEVSEVTTEMDMFGQNANRPATPYFIVYIRDSVKDELTNPLFRVIDVPDEPDVPKTDVTMDDYTQGESLEVIEGIEPP